MNKQLTRNAALLLNSLFVTSGVISFSLLPAVANATEISRINAESSQTPTQSANRSEVATVPNGVYLYGESQQPDQIGSAYLVFEVSDNQAVGAFYLPHSSFDCFQGEVQGDRLNLTITNSYDQNTYAYSLPIQTDSYVASAVEVAPPTVQLNGFHSISSVSDNDHRILETCKADFL